MRTMSSLPAGKVPSTTPTTTPPPCCTTWAMVTSVSLSPRTVRSTLRAGGPSGRPVPSATSSRYIPQCARRLQTSGSTIPGGRSGGGWRGDGLPQGDRHSGGDHEMTIHTTELERLQRNFSIRYLTQFEKKSNLSTLKNLTQDISPN